MSIPVGMGLFTSVVAIARCGGGMLIPVGDDDSTSVWAEVAGSSGFGRKGVIFTVSLEVVVGPQNGTKSS